MNGDIVYLELAITEIENTLSFYTSVFGWKIKESFYSSQKYFMFESPSKFITGGFDANLKPSLEGVLIYVQVACIDTVLNGIEKDYPTVKILKRKTFISKEYGAYALLIDPSNNRIGLQEYSKLES